MVSEYFEDVTNVVDYMRNYHMIRELIEDESSWDYFMESNIIRDLYTHTQLSETDEINEILIKIRILQIIHQNSMNYIQRFQNSDTRYQYKIQI